VSLWRPWVRSASLLCKYVWSLVYSGAFLRILKH
jgi:hypothetical protein